MWCEACNEEPVEYNIKTSEGKACICEYCLTRKITELEAYDKIMIYRVPTENAKPRMNFPNKHELSPSNTTTPICHHCLEPIAWSDHYQEWHTISCNPREHYVNVCNGNRL